MGKIMKIEKQCPQLQYIKLMKNKHSKDIKAAWSAGVAYGKHLAKNTTDDSNVPDFYTWVHKYFIKREIKNENN